MSAGFSRRAALWGAAGLGAGVLSGVWGGACRGRAPLRVGLLWSRTGDTALAEQAMSDAAQLALARVNAEGGIGGRRVEALTEDPGSEPERYAEAAESLLRRGAQVLIGGYTSASRKAALEVVARRDALLLYPLQFEGLEEAPGVVYVASVPNQQMSHALRYARMNFGRRAWLWGSDYVYARAANAIASDLHLAVRGELAGESWLRLSQTDVAAAKAVAEATLDGRPDFVVHNLMGSAGLRCVEALRALERSRGLGPVPVLSFTLSELELARLDPGARGELYSAWSWFAALESAENARFLADAARAWGAERPVGEPMAMAFTAVILWAEAARRTADAEAGAVREALRGLAVPSPLGMVYVDEQSLHVWLPAHLGQARPEGQFRVIWEGRAPVRPRPFPPSRTRPEWESFLAQLQQGYGGRWSAD